MGSLDRLLARGPGYAAPPPTPAELEDAVEAHQQRHRLRLSGLERLRQLEVELSESLDEALQPIAVPVTSSWFTRALISAGLLQETPQPPPPLETLWARHERALEKVRALSHHVELLDRDLAQIDADIPQLSARIKVLSVDRVKAEAHEVALLSARQRVLDEAPADQGVRLKTVDAALSRTRRDRARLAAAVERLRSVKLLHQDLHDVLVGVSEGLEQLTRDANAALDGLNRRISGLAVEAAAAELGGGGLDALHHTLTELAVTAGKKATWLESNLDTLSDRLARLDAEAAERRRAREEVEAALGDTGA